MSNDADEEDCSPSQPLLPTALRRSASNTTSQVALVGSNLSPIESLDYEIAENDLFKQDWRRRSKIQIGQYIFMKWTLCFLLGTLVCLIGFTVNLSVENIAGIKFVVTSNMMLYKKYLMAFLVFSVSNFSLTLLSSLITEFISREAAGSGIPEVKAYLNGVDAPGIFSLRTLVVKIVGSVLAVSSSLVIGKAGPMVHVGGCVAALVAQGGSKKYRLTWKWLQYFKNDRDLRDLVTCGSAAGMAVSFRAPVGGLLFAFEEMASWKGAFYKILLACSISIFTSLLLFGLPWLASCQPCPADATEPCPTIGRSGNYKKFQCRPGHYNDLASLIFNTNDDAIKNLFSKNTDSEFHLSSICIFFVTCFFLSIFSYGIAVPAGLFVPVILIGASYGRLVGMLVGSHSNLNHGLFAVLGSASLLGGSMRMTVSLCVIILELTNNLLLLPLVMLVLLVSKTVADAFNGNIYDLIMKLKAFPYLEAHAEPYMRLLTVGDVVTGPLQVFHAIEKVSNIVHVLRTTRHNGFPVIDDSPFSETPMLFGLVLRAHLLTLLKKKAFQPTPVRISDDALEQFTSENFAKQGLGDGDKIEDVDLTEEDMEMFIDLHPFTNTSPYTVVETMSLAKALILFREVGLRHLLVVPKMSNGQPVVGILTRHDFMPEYILAWHPLLVRSRWKRLRIQLPRWVKFF
ncbi:putative chloride channel-like protein CLC-g isoform X3 [Diospyros lotus]|uniref:putative chloride channel-like protein CLC-g isoform X3 n=1 Tax=Diospyros lotus TaxID=55363 RepID=UPI002258E948|nr:putative chloride channel-like protein CLC-g isoform X3 [Diospyros lotus]